MTRNYRIFCRDMTNSTSLDAEQWGADEWRYTGPDYGGMLVANRGHMVKALADSIGNGKVYRIDTPGGSISIDRLGGTWGYIEDRYYAAGELLPLLIPAESLEVPT